MFPTFLITFREVIEASLIVSLILSILIKLKQKKSIKTVWLAVATAFLTSIVFVFIGSLFGFEVSKLYEKYEQYIEGILMLFSTIFITWTVFFLHKYFSGSQKKLTQKIIETIGKKEQKNIFILVFAAVFREGFEIIIFLSTLYFSSTPKDILTGFITGTIAGLGVAFTLFVLTKKIAITKAIRATNIFLILFSAGLLIRGIHEFAELKLLPEIGVMQLSFIPPATTFFGTLSKSIFGITNEIDLIQIIFYFAYIFLVGRLVLFKHNK